MHHKAKKLFYFLFFICFLGFAPFVMAQSLEVYNLVLDNSNATLKVKFDLKIEGFGAIKRSLDEGERLGLVYTASVHEQRNFIWDKSLVHRSFLIIMHKDMLKGEYVINISGQDYKFPKFSPQKINSLFQDIEISLSPWSIIKKGHNYSLKVEVALKTLGIPEWIKKTLFFWSWDLVEPEYFEMEFSY